MYIKESSIEFQTLLVKHLFVQPIYAPWSTKLVDERWSDAGNLDEGIQRMKNGDYAFLEASQTMLQALGNFL